MIVPIRARYRPDEAIETLGRYALHTFPLSDPSRYRIFEVPVMPAPTLTFGSGPRGTASSMLLEHLSLERRLYAREETLAPRERRVEARRGTTGRRGARAVPISTRWEVEAFQPSDAPEEVAA